MREFLEIDFDNASFVSIEVTDGMKPAEEAIMEAHANGIEVDYMELVNQSGEKIGDVSIEWSVKLVQE